MARSVRSRRVILAATIGAALLTGSARAEDPFFVGDQLTTTSYSGWAGTISSTGEVGMFEGGMGGLIGITWYEDRDQPYLLGTHLRTLPEGSEAYINGDGVTYTFRFLIVDQAVAAFLVNAEFETG